MSANLRALRRRILTPKVSEVRLGKRGFHTKDPAARRLLESVGLSFLDGYGHAVEVRTPAELEHRLDGVPRELRGFAYEGAAMGCSVLDALPGTSGRRLAGLLAGEGRHHVYMAYVGIGWAMARLPRALWPDLTGTVPLLRWLVLDGYGFHQAYFHTAKYVHGQFQDASLPWRDGPASYVPRAVDQGIGRALWFVGGSDPDVVADLVERFPEERRADLYGGAGLAATYAGGSDETELRRLAERAGRYRPCLQQGSVFAAEARERAGLTVAHTRLATRVFCGMEPETAAGLCQELRPALDSGGSAYEEWRRAIADACVSAGGAGTS
ncbi:DUF1702 family protein [Streptomyces clavuligerus]|uniref:Enediyne biosynthesis protein UnbL n=1 Tax=Streptomyces clavuligerus TaxID=1901 RepID=B5GYS4_STRCL|nr:DUF1702 family protein [Streptomyces clavuligerus]ANW22583.1 enediyne biosynthesis protein [Streptomyces clavuligerus]AXU16946.1 DUF1702 family protein [Streptomyces clavuligerus]AXU17469.1 DUF1702 family protein [Streptomyces clavuligerus]EDY51470.1 UnbL [Streptomyces clavuligerus]EFG04716.1 Enediyne biosynthesis protein UnbL [Streptomyces clavuligerus]